MAKPGTLLAQDRALLQDALAALRKGRTEVTEQYLEDVIQRMAEASSYKYPEQERS